MRHPPLPASSMAAAADVEVANVLSLCTGPPPFNEVATVAHIVTKAAPAIATAWTPLLAAHGCTFDLTGVFCHQHPQVSFSHAYSPVELADLLLVIDYHFGGQATRRAALVQAKMDRSGRVVIGPGKPQAQLALLSTWPSFTFLTAGYDHRSRDFGTEIMPNVEECGRYGAIDLVSAPPFWGQIDPTSTKPFMTSLGHSLGSFMAEMADDTPGFGATAACVTGTPAPSLHDWSFTVAELLHVTYGLVHAAMTRAGASGGRRGITAVTMTAPMVGPAPDIPYGELGFVGAEQPDAQPDRPSHLSLGGIRGISLIHGVIERV